MTSDFDNSTPPPLPPELPAAMPVAAAHTPPPMPVAALPYQLPQYNGRPGILTAIGVISIVVASISIVTTTVSGCYEAIFYTASQSTRAMSRATATVVPPAPPVVVTGPVTSPTGASSATTTNADDAAEVDTLPTGDEGLGARDRRVAIDALNAMQPLNEARRRQLEQFLAEKGQALFPTAGLALTEPMVRATINSSHGGSANIRFVSSRGTLIVDDNSTEFRRPDGTQSVRTSATSSVATRTVGPFGYAALTPQEAQQVAQTASNMAAPTGLSALQTATLVKELQSPTQQLLPVKNIPSPIMQVINFPDGSVMVQFVGASSITIDGKGMITQNFSAVAMVTGPSTMNSAAVLGLVAEALVSLALAGLLLTAGILVIRQSRLGRRFHRIYAWTKIPVALLGWWGIGWLMYKAVASFAGPMSAGPTGAAFAMGVAVPGIVSLIYPIALLIVFRTKSVEAYYRDAQESD